MEKEQLKILILEDVPSDAELMEYELTETGLNFSSRRVASKTAFTKELAEFSPHLILSDYSLPSFDGLSALQIVMAKNPELPFIFVSGALGEEMAIELLKQGATDYVLKDRLSRLGPAVLRALQEAKDRSDRRLAEQALQESESRYRTIFENTGTASIIIDEKNSIILANRRFEKLSGYSRSEIEGLKRWTEFVFEEDLAKVEKSMGWETGKDVPSPGEYEFRLVNLPGDICYVWATVAPIPSTGNAVISLLDITERKRAEQALQKRESELHLKSQSLEEANTALKVLLKHREEDRYSMEEQMLTNVKKQVLPYLEELKHLRLKDNQMACLEVIERQLSNICSPFLRNLSSAYLNLTPREIQVATLVKDGKTTKEITDLLGISIEAVDFHRKNLRLKFGIKNKRTNLRSYLASLSA